jgi:hypothetical protein
MMVSPVSSDVQWLRSAPRCRTEGSMVYVTLLLEPGKLTGPACVAWSAGGLHATTPKIKGQSVTCCVPRGIFEHRALMRLQMLGSAESDRPVLPWTQIPVLEETLFRAEMVGGRPVLSSLASPPMQRASRSSLSPLEY